MAIFNVFTEKQSSPKNLCSCVIDGRFEKTVSTLGPRKHNHNCPLFADSPKVNNNFAERIIDIIDGRIDRTSYSLPSCKHNHNCSCYFDSNNITIIAETKNNNPKVIVFWDRGHHEI